jgi:hypothetical protein
MKSIGKWVLGAAVLAGGMVLGTSTADAAQWRVSVGVGQSAYIPPCPGPGYTWVNGYYDGGYWVPGSWNYVGGASYTYYGTGYRHYDRDDHRGWDRDRDRRVYDRDDHRRFDRDDHRRYDRDDHRDRDHDRWHR